jgi:hypothetical protein
MNLSIAAASLTTLFTQGCGAGWHQPQQIAVALAILCPR